MLRDALTSMLSPGDVFAPAGEAFFMGEVLAQLNAERGADVWSVPSAFSNS
jgi:hypothetical protein